MPTMFLNRRESGDRSMLCDAVEFADGAEQGERCVESTELRDIGGDSFTGAGVEFVVTHRLCRAHYACFARTHMLIERCG